MKKLKSILFIFVMLMVSFSVVYADSPLEDSYPYSWGGAYSSQYNEFFYDAIEVRDGIVAIGGVDDENSVAHALIVKYGKDGKQDWVLKYDEKSFAYRIVEIDDGYLVYAEKYGEDMFADNILLFIEYNSKTGKYEITKEVVLGVAGFGNELRANLTKHGDEVVAYCSGDAYLYNLKTNVVKLLESSFDIENAIINEKGIFIVESNNDNGKRSVDANSIIIKKMILDSDSYKEEKKLSFKNDMGYGVSSFDYMNEKILVGMENGNVHIIGSDLKSEKSIKVKRDDVDEDIFDIGKTKDGFVVLMYDYDSEKSLVRKFNFDGVDAWGGKVIELGFEAAGIVPTFNGFVVIGASDKEKVTDVGSQMDEFTNAGGLDAYMFKYIYSKFDVEVQTDGNGKVSAEVVDAQDKTYAELTVEPNSGYKLKSMKAITLDGKEIEIKDNKFDMPQSDVVVYAEFTKLKGNVLNPNTGLSNPYVICGVLGLGSLLGYLVFKKKKFIS